MSLQNREIDDKISKVMGSYLLKGYTLLDDYCQTCQTPLMRPRNGENYCIYCNEINVKSKEMNINSSNESPDVCQMVDESVSIRDELMNDENEISIEQSFNLHGLQFKRDIETTLLVVQKKLKWATNRLDYCDNVNDCIPLTQLIKSCADSLQSLKKLIDNNRKNE